MPEVPKANLGGGRLTTLWAEKELPAREADEGFYRISGVKGSGKSQITKLFMLDVLREVEANPHAKLVAYDPKREFYAWLCSLGLSSPVNYFCPSDERSVALDFSRDYTSSNDCRTLANAFYPHDPHEKQRFWGDSLRTIYAGVYEAILEKCGYADLRLMCLVLEDEDLTRKVLGRDEYLVQARKLAQEQGGNVGDTAKNIYLTIHSRVAEMKALASHLEYARRDVGLFSLREFVKGTHQGVLVVSKDSDYADTQDPLNGILFLRLTQLLDKEQQHPERRVYVVIDEFPTLAGDKPCPGITDMFLRLRSRGVTVLITYQAHTTLKRVYGETATENIGQCTNVIHLKQPDVESANYAADDLGRERGYEKTRSTSFGGGGSFGGMSQQIPTASWNIQQNQQWYERPIYSPTELLNHLRQASRATGVEGRAKSPLAGPRPWSFRYPPELIDRIPRRHPDVPEYVERNARTQRLTPLSDEERNALLGRTAAEAEVEAWDKFNG